MANNLLDNIDLFEMKRLRLHDTLCALLGSDNVYYQPPEGFRMSYPCFRYNLTDIDNRNANNKSYIRHLQYQIMYITKEPVPDMIQRVEDLPLCSFDRPYISDNLYHYVFTIYL